MMWNDVVISLWWGSGSIERARQVLCSLCERTGVICLFVFLWNYEVISPRAVNILIEQDKFYFPVWVDWCYLSFCLFVFLWNDVVISSSESVERARQVLCSLCELTGVSVSFRAATFLVLHSTESELVPSSHETHFETIDPLTHFECILRRHRNNIE